MLKKSGAVLFSLLAFALLFRFLTLMIFHTGIDESDYWYAAKALANGLPYPELTHRTVRWAVILPVAAAQLVLGSGPSVYYLLPVLNTLLQAAIAWDIGKRLRGDLTAFAASFALIVFPYMIRAGSQIRPEIFSMTFVLLAVLSLVRYMEKDGAERFVPIAGMTLWLFAAYESKITNLFFLPGFCAAIWLYKKKPLDVCILGASLFLLFLAETGLYGLLAGFPGGHLQIIAANHLAETEGQIENMRFIDLFRRYSPEYLQPYWQVPFVLFAAAGTYYLVRRAGDKRLKSIVVAAASFFFFLTFAVGGLHPLKPAEAFINRYFCAVLGPVFLVSAYALEGLSLKLGFLAFLLNRKALIAVVGLSAAALIFGAVFKNMLPRGAREYLNSPLALNEHPLVLGERYRREANAAYEAGIPIAAVSGLPGENATRAVARFLIDVKNFQNGKPPAAREADIGGKKYLYVSEKAQAEFPPELEAVVRDPFRMTTLPRASIEKLGPDRFPPI
jgi:hypothetical protein